MRIIQPSAEIMDDFRPEELLKKIELCGRVCYKSEDRITGDSANRFIADIIKRGHESVLEHVNISVRFICDRGVTHEIVRHRLASYSQESTRYCNYTQDKFDNEITVIEPLFFDEGSSKYICWQSACEDCEREYFNLLELGATAQEARSVLPNSLKTEIIMTCNIREWRHFLKLRTSPASHPQMGQVANMLLEQFVKLLPALFQDLLQTK